MAKKIFDCFTFFNELELLSIRLEYLYDVVDYFVIVEADMGFSGKPKEYVLKQHWALFEKYSSKIIYLPIAMPHFKQAPNVAWLREEHQRNQLKIALKQGKVSSKDIVLIGDVDEIPNAVTLQELKTNSKTFFDNTYAPFKYVKAIFDRIFNGDKQKLKLLQLTNKMNSPVSFSMVNCLYFVNFKEIAAQWSGTVAVEQQLLAHFSIEDIRKLRNYCNSTPNAGWHFSYLGGKEKIKQKLQNYAHQEYNKPEILSDEFIDTCIEKGYSLSNYYKGRIKVAYENFSVELFPYKLKKILLHYPNLLHRRN